MWYTVIFFAIVALLAVGAILESRKRRAVNRRWRHSLSADSGSYPSSSGSFYGHGGYGDSGTSSSGDCGSGGGGGDGGGGGGGC